MLVVGFNAQAQAGFDVVLNAAKFINDLEES